MVVSTFLTKKWMEEHEFDAKRKTQELLNHLCGFRLWLVQLRIKLVIQCKGHNWKIGINFVQQTRVMTSELVLLQNKSLKN